MKLVISFLFISIFFIPGFSQSLHIYHYGIDVTGDTVNVPVTANSFHIDSLDIHNTSSSSITFNVNRTIGSLDSCDYVYFSLGTICYPSHTESTWAAPSGATTIASGAVLPDGLGANGMVAHYDVCPTTCFDTYVLYRFYNVAAATVDTARVVMHYLCVTAVEENSQLCVSSSAYPNPANSLVSIAYEVKEQFVKGEIFLYDVSGKCLKMAIIADKKGAIHMNISDLDNGIYFYSIVLDGKKTATQKLIICSE